MAKCGRSGIIIVCRPSQFARFIVLRHDHGGVINGIRDLYPELLPLDGYNPIDESAYVAETQVRRVLRESAGMLSDEQIARVMCLLKEHRREIWTYKDMGCVDVSDRLNEMYGTNGSSQNGDDGGLHHD